MSRPLRAVVYRRQSRDQHNDELGIERQLTVCKALCERRSYDLTQVVTDNSVTASKRGRKGYAEVLQLMRAGLVDVDVILRIDRLMRLNDELEELIKLVEQYPVQVVTAEGDIDLSTPQGRLVARILVSVARNEMETKSARHRLANAQKAAQGLPHGSRRPFGYQADLVTIHEPEAALLRSMAAMVLAGQSYKDMAYYLNQTGYTTTQGKLWYPITVRNPLTRPRYAGIREYNGAQYQGSWQPVFDAETWQRLQLTIRLRKEAGSGMQGRKYLLTGLAYCGKCGTPLNGQNKRDKPDRPLRRTYYCRVQGDTKPECRQRSKMRPMRRSKTRPPVRCCSVCRVLGSDAGQGVDAAVA